MKALGRRPDHGVALGIEGDDGDRTPVSGVPRPAARGSCPRMLIEGMASLQDGVVLAGMSLCRADVADATVPVIVVVPTDEPARPLAGVLDIREALCRELRPVLRRAEQRLDEGLSSLTRGREYEARSPSQFIIARTVVALSVEPLSPCSTGL